MIGTPAVLAVIVNATADAYGVDRRVLRSRCRTRAVSRIRALAADLCRRLTDASLPAIAKALGGLHHTTVLDAIRRIEDERAHGTGGAAEAARVEYAVRAALAARFPGAAS